MPHVPHQTTPFRRPANGNNFEIHHDPADMGTAFGLEMCLESLRGDPAELVHLREAKRVETPPPTLLP